MRSYESARAVLSFMGIIGWIVAAAGVFAAIAALSELGALSAAVIGASGVIAGLVQVALSQIGLAVISTAETSAAMLEELRGSSAARVAREPSTPADVDVPAAAPRATSKSANRSLVRVYRDVAIERTGNGIEADGRVFEDVKSAEAYIETLTGR